MLLLGVSLLGWWLFRRLIGTGFSSTGVLAILLGLGVPTRASPATRWTSRGFPIFPALGATVAVLPRAVVATTRRGAVPVISLTLLPASFISPPLVSPSLVSPSFVSPNLVSRSVVPPGWASLAVPSVAVAPPGSPWPTTVHLVSLPFTLSSFRPVFTLAVLWRWAGSTRGPTATPIHVALRGVFASLDGGSVGSRDLGGLGPLGALDHDELHALPVPHAAQVLAGVVLDDGGLVYKDVL